MEHPGEILAVAISPDGRLVATAGDDRTIRLWDIATGSPVGEAMQHEAGVFAIAFSPGWPRPGLGLPGRLGAPFWHGRGRRDRPAVRTRSDDPRRGVQPRRTHHPDGERGPHGAALGRRDRRPVGRPIRHRQFVDGVAFSPDGRTILTASWDHTARLWDAATGAPSAGRWRTMIGSPPWRSAPTARPSSPEGTTGRRGSGTPRPAHPSASRSGISTASLGRLQPRREADHHGVLRRHRPTLGGRQRPPPRRPLPPSAHRHLGRVQPGRADRALRAATTGRRGSGRSPSPEGFPWPTRAISGR